MTALLDLHPCRIAARLRARRLTAVRAEIAALRLLDIPTES